MFKTVKDSLGGTLIPLIAALVVIGLGIAFAHAAPIPGSDMLFSPPWMLPLQGSHGLLALP